MSEFTTEKTLVEEKPKDKFCCANWIFIANFAAITFGIALYLIAVDFSGEGLAGIRYMGPCSLFFLLFCKFSEIRNTKKKIGTLIDYNNSNLFC